MIVLAYHGDDYDTRMYKPQLNSGKNYTSQG